MAECCYRKMNPTQASCCFKQLALKRVRSAARNLGDAVALQTDAGHQAALGEGERVDVAARGGGGERGRGAPVDDDDGGADADFHAG